jgi:hypothetical protein
MTTFEAPAIWSMLPYPKGPWQPCWEPSCNDPACVTCQAAPLLDPDDNPIPCEHQLACSHSLSFGYHPTATFAPMHAAHGNRSISTIAAQVGRQAGKTTADGADLWEALTKPDDGFGGPSVLLGADTFDHVYKVLDPMLWQIDQSPFLRALKEGVNHNRKVLKFHPGKWNSGAKLEWLSGQEPEAWSGFTSSHAVWDESQYIPDTAIENIKPALMARKAQTVATGVCLSGDETQWWQSACLLAEEGAARYLHIQASSTAGPWNSKVWIEEQRESMTEDWFRSLILAEWTEASTCFTEIEALFDDRLTYHEPEKRRTYVAGLDVSADGPDWTVLTIADAITAEIVFDRRYEGSITYKEQQVARDLKRYDAAVAVDATGIGKMWLPGIRRQGVHVAPYIFNESSKMNLVQGLQRALEQRRMHSPLNPALQRELRLFRQIGTTARNIPRYSAPSGYHDDRVIALALCAWMLDSAAGRPKPRNRTMVYA